MEMCRKVWGGESSWSDRREGVRKKSKCARKEVQKRFCKDDCSVCVCVHPFGLVDPPARIRFGVDE